MTAKRKFPKKHPFVLLDHPYYDGKIEVDEKIAPLVQALWNADFLTTSSCQGDDQAFLSFEDPHTALDLQMTFGPRFNPEAGAETLEEHFLTVWEASTLSAPDMMIWSSLTFPSQDIERFATLVQALVPAKAPA